MLSFVFTDTDGNEHILCHPLSLTIRMDEKVPADDFFAVFAYLPTGELVKAAVYDNSKLLFIGVVDEQTTVLTKNGMNLQISARSLAARLLDNEAQPQCYDHPSASLIYERHVKPFGILWTLEDDATCFGEQQVNKGMSHWTVLKNFCAACYSSVPRITSDGVLKMKDSVPSDSIVFSDEGGIGYTELREEIKRCEELSRVNVKISDEEGYRFQIDNPDAIRRGIHRERYLNAVLTATPMTCADAMLRSAAAASYELRLSCAGRLTDAMGCAATVKNRMLGVRDGLYVSGLTYRLDRGGETTALRLKRRDPGCGFQDM